MGKIELPIRSLPTGTEMNLQNHCFPFSEGLPEDCTENNSVLLSNIAHASSPTKNYCHVLLWMIHNAHLEEILAFMLCIYHKHVEILILLILTNINLDGQKLRKIYRVDMTRNITHVTKSQLSSSNSCIKTVPN